MKTIKEVPVDQILSNLPAVLSKSTTMGGLILAAWEAKQRGEKTITITTDTTVQPCKCCNPPFEL